MRTNEQAEIEFLERLHRIEVPTMDRELNRLAEVVSGDMVRAAQRAGTSGPWCFSCGSSGVSLDRCTCDFSESFGCTGKLFCADCRKSRQSVANHVQKLLDAKKVDRISSIRLRLLRELRSAARSLEGDSDAGDSRLLSYWLANADEFSDDGDGFRAGILRAFQRTHFIDFAALAKALRQAQDESLLRAVIRSGLYR